MWALQLVLLALTSVAGQMTASWRNSVVAEHNKARTTLANPLASNMMPLVYNQSIEAIAQKYLDTKYPNGCPSGFDHNANRGDFGENWYSGQPMITDSDPGATAAWTTEAILLNKLAGKQCSERDNFYSLNGCVQAPCYDADGIFNTSWNTGHFTQVMWATTTQIGCGYKSGCGTLCNYYPAGNTNLPNGLLNPTDVWKTNSGISHPLPKRLKNNPISLLRQPPTTTAAPTTTQTLGPNCLWANDPSLAALTPSSSFPTGSGCTATSSRPSDCQVCGPQNVSQTGSTPVTFNITLVCSQGDTILGHAGLIDVLIWSVNGAVATNDNPSIVTYGPMYTMNGGDNAVTQAEWCVNGQYFAAFQTTVVHS